MFDLQVLAHGIGVILRLAKRICRRVCGALRWLLALLLALLGRGEREETKRDRGCIRPPDWMLARPDPYVYSQFWLEQRGLAYTWDNPDFAIVDPGTGTKTNSHELQPAKLYRVEVTIHNASLMAALGTQVGLDVLHFGAGLPPQEALGQVTIDVPGGASAIARFDWTTPPEAGHNCLRATISHFDDANPQNNVGQHNTDVAVPASPERALEFGIALPEQGGDREVEVAVDGYELPADPRCAGSFDERGTDQYRERLQREHDPARFPVAGFLAPRLVVGGEAHGFEGPEGERAERTLAARRGAPPAARRRAVTRIVHPGGELGVALVMEPPPAGEGRRAVNVNVFDAGHLVGGVTAYVEEG